MDKKINEFKQRWGAWASIVNGVVICRSRHAQRRWDVVLEKEAKELIPPHDVKYEITQP